jgi:hypothetical protein
MLMPMLPQNGGRSVQISTVDKAKGRDMSLAQDFVEFWQAYPRRIGKLAAQKAYEKARKSGVTQQQLLDGIAAYVAHKPAYADWAHARTWLSQGRWEDEYDVPVSKPSKPAYDWFEECKVVHGGACGLDRYRHMTRVQHEQARARGEAV